VEVAQVQVRLFSALGALVTVAGLTAWGLATPSKAARQPATQPTPIKFAAPIVNPLTVTHPPVLAVGWHQIFKGVFSGTRLNTSVWATCYPWSDVPSGCTNSGNSEFEWYLPSQDLVYKGALHLVAKRRPTAGQTSSGRPKQYPCRSGMITSFPKLRFKYGYVKVVARLASSYGLWSAVWLAAANRQWPPEIDLIETWGMPWVRAGVYFHPRGAKGAKTKLGPAEAASLDTGWHTFSLSWSYSKLVWFVDGRAVLIIGQHIPHQDMYLIANLADYAMNRTAGCAGRLLVRSVEVWQR